jgi:hypothetical protein
MRSNDSPDSITVGDIEHSQGVAIGAGATAIVGYTAEQVSALLGQIGTTFQPKPFDGRSPYVGLAAFQEVDADRFFGREKLISELVSRVDASRPHAIFIAGPSGSGKSSLARAGLMHALKTGALPKSETWLYETMQPGRAPVDELGRVVSRWANSVKAGNEFRASANDPTMFHRWADIALSDARDRRAILLVDQFEETFTQVSRDDERLAFLNLLTHAATVENGRVTILFALRSDFVSHCAAYPQLNGLINQQFFQVGAMSPDELVSAMAQPALRVGLRIDPDLIAQIVNEMRDAPSELPLMQFALNDLFEAQRAKGGIIALTLPDYLARGGLFKALERHADTAFAQLDESEQKLARVIFSGVIEIGRGTMDTRRTAWFDELVPTGVSKESVETVVEKLADARLVATDERDGKQTVTLAHDRLIDAWQWLRRLVNENREAIAIQNQIAQDAREWEQNKRDAGYLYTGARLAQAVEWKAKNEFRLNQPERDLIQDSLTAQQIDLERRAERKQLRYLRQAFGGAIGTGMGYGLGFALAFWSNNPTSIDLVPIIFLTIFPMGGLVGFAIGLCLWLWRAQKRDQILSAALVGMLIGGITFILYLIATTTGGYNLSHVLAGALLGASLGVSASFPTRRLIRLLTLTISGLLAAELVAILTGAISANLLIVGVVGLMLGGFAGLGFYLSAVSAEKDTQEEP